ncbi:MAG: ABC transporter permease subunit [Lachnospiraceae bacterium]|nr:ABC transporter permease subunit [Lachnospiraceae bacterium]
MIAVFKREFKSYFNDMLGYFIIAVILLFFGLSFSFNNIEGGSPFYAHAIAGIIAYMPMLIPILTQRSFSDERRSKTDQLLLTSPVSVWKIVLGKYLAMVAVFAIPVLVSCVYPVIIYMTGTYAYPTTDYATILAFFLIGASYIAIGMFFSSITESQIIAALLAFGSLFLLEMMKDFSEKIPADEWKNVLIFIGVAVVFFLIFYKMTQNFYVSFSVFAAICIGILITYKVNPDIYYNSMRQILHSIPYAGTLVYFATNIFDIPSIVLYLSVALFFCFLTIQSIQKRRYS